MFQGPKKLKVLIIQFLCPIQDFTYYGLFSEKTMSFFKKIPPQKNMELFFHESCLPWGGNIF